MKNYSKIATFIAGLSLVTSSVLAPVFVFAKENDNKDDKNCLRAFGHLVAPGWIKHNGPISLGTECNLPFGIGKKHDDDGKHGTTTPPIVVITPDTTAPVLSSINLNPRITDTVVQWTTNEKSDSAVFYSTTSPVTVGTTGTLTMTRSNLTTDHRLTLNLLASTTYHLIVRSRDASGNTATSSEVTFTTNSPSVTPPVVDVTAPIMTNALAIVGSTTVQLSWKTNETATTKAYYSTSTPIDITATSTLFVENTSLLTAHTMTVSGLATSTLYHMILESKDATGNPVRTSEFSFTTSAGM